MSTSRGATPADPVLNATTDDNSRGGLFVRSNIANPVEGADVQGTVVGTGNITINASINGGTVVPVTFNVNDSQDRTLPLALTVDVSGGSNNNSGGDPVVSGELVERTNPNDTLRLMLQSQTRIDIDVSELVTQAELTTAINGIVPGVSTFVALTDGPRSISRSNTGQYLTANAAGDALEWLPLPGNVLNVDDFESADNTIVDTVGTQTGRIDLSARPALVGNNGQGDNVGSNPQNARRIILDVDTGLVLDRNATTGDITIRRAHASAARAEAAAPAPTSALDAPTQEERTVVYTPQGTDTITMIDNVRVTGPQGNIVIPPANIDTTDPMRGTIEIPQASIDDPGSYRVRAEVTTETAQGVTQVTDEDNTIMRILPYFQSRTEPMTQTDLENAARTTSFLETLNAMTGFTSISGSAVPLYFAVRDSILDNSILFATSTGGQVIQITFVRRINVTLADGSTQEPYNVFSTPVAGAAPLSNFRSTFF